MTDDVLSALLDDECSADELDQLLNDMASNDALKQTFSRMCLTREAAAGVRVQAAQRCICDAVMSQLEPHVPMAVIANVRPSMQRRAPRRRYVRRSAIGLALAASAAAVVVGVWPLSEGGDAQRSNTLAVANPSSVDTTVAATNLRLVSATDREGQRVALEDELRPYLMEHSNSLADRGMGATLSYARATAYGSNVPMAQSVSFDLGGQP